ncbi:hypothetical protein AAHA92_00026 [Salvia divinorum]|uniref:Uncharacterized protein n=1 Tax=Salvia divinorum TaxID=28513 RepID=A0ABD1IMF2_SALDI
MWCVPRPDESMLSSGSGLVHPLQRYRREVTDDYSIVSRACYDLIMLLSLWRSSVILSRRSMCRRQVGWSAQPSPFSQQIGTD